MFFIILVIFILNKYLKKMKKKIVIKESDIMNIVKKVIKESNNNDIIGKRIRMIQMSDDPRISPIEPGTEGEIIMVSYHVDGDVINVKWDNGRNLGVIVGEDEYEILDDVMGEGEELMTEVGGYDDPDSMMHHEGAYMSEIAYYTDDIVRSYSGLKNIYDTITDDNLKNQLDEFLGKLSDGIQDFRKVFKTSATSMGNKHRRWSDN